MFGSDPGYYLPGCQHGQHSLPGLMTRPGEHQDCGHYTWPSGSGRRCAGRLKHGTRTGTGSLLDQLIRWAGGVIGRQVLLSTCLVMISIHPHFGFHGCTSYCTEVSCSSSPCFYSLALLGCRARHLILARTLWSSIMWNIVSPQACESRGSDSRSYMRLASEVVSSFRTQENSNLRLDRFHLHIFTDRCCILCYIGS